MPTVAYYGNDFESFKAAVGFMEGLYETETLPPDNTVDVIVIDKSTTPDMTVPIGSIGVVLSDNREGLQTLMKSGVRTVTCGMSYRDTVTLSATLGHLTVCLQRRLPVVGGFCLEPAEFPIDSNGFTDDRLLLACAVRLLCGLEPK